MGRVWSGWEDFLTQPTMVSQKKFNPTQPNPHESGWVGLNPWVWQIIIIIKLSKKNININILKKPKDYYQCNSLKANNTNDQTTIVIY